MRGTYCLLILVQYDSYVRYPPRGSPKLFLFQGFQWLMLSQTEQIPNDNISSKDCVNFHFGTCALSFHKKHF